MSRLLVPLACCVLVSGVLSVRAAEEAEQVVPVVGYIVPVPSDDETADALENGAFCVRNGERLGNSGT